MKKNLKKILPWMFAGGAAISPLEKIAGNAYSQESLNPAPVGAPLVPGQMDKAQNPGLYRFNGKLVDVTDQKTALPGKILTFISPQGVPYTVST